MTEFEQLRNDKELLDWLERFLQLGGSSIFTSTTCRAHEDRPDDTATTRWNHPFCVGYDVETEHRGCYRWEELSNGAKGLRPALAAARAKHAAQLREQNTSTQGIIMSAENEQPAVSTEAGELSTLEEFMRLDKIVRDCEDSIRTAEHLKARGRWKPEWDVELVQLRAQLEKALRERTWLDAAVARYAAAQKPAAPVLP